MTQRAGSRSAPTPLEEERLLPFMARHDSGCQCWPHVSEKDALEAIERAGLAEYRDGKKALATARAEGAAEERERLRNYIAVRRLDITLSDIEDALEEPR